MPRKLRTPASLELNRENQRRSRARHREYINELQRRVQEFEERDAQATLEMQKVARAVAEDNAFLKELLAMKGVQKDEIQGFLDARRAQQAVSSNSLASSPVVQQQPLWDHIKYESQHPALTATYPHDPMQYNTAYSAFTDDSTSSSTDTTLLEQPQSRDEMHCSEAASILAQLRGSADKSAAHTALGCAEGQNCTIRNADLFQVMDKLT